MLGVLVDEQEKDMQRPDYRTADEYYADMARAEKWERTHGDWAPGLPPVHRIAGRTVVVEYVNPPIELRDFDYCAHFLSNDLGDPQGYGITAAAALEDLREKCE